MSNFHLSYKLPVIICSVRVRQDRSSVMKKFHHFFYDLPVVAERYAKVVVHRRSESGNSLVFLPLIECLVDVDLAEMVAKADDLVEMAR